LEWGKLAKGAPPTAGDYFCPKCRAEFNADAFEQVLERLRGSGDGRWEPWRGRVLPLSTWYIAASGKTSLRAGWLCRACSAEFDDEAAGLKAIRMPPGSLSALVNQVYSLADWYRRAVGAPTALEEKRLREECERLQRYKQQEQAETLRLRRENQSRLEEELNRLLKQALVEGFHPLQLQSAQIYLRDQETLHWEGAGRKLKQRTSGGSTYWETEAQGTLLVTLERMILDSSPHKLWQRPLSELLRVDRQHLPEGVIIVLWLDGLQKPVGLWAADLKQSVSVGSQTRTIKLDASDLAQLLQTLAGKGK
jgi:hypothetical protein